MDPGLEIVDNMKVWAAVFTARSQNDSQEMERLGFGG